MQGTKGIVLTRLAITVVCATILSSCANHPPVVTPTGLVLPAEALFNEGAGHGDMLYVVVRLESGEKLLFNVDTGAPVTVLDQSLENRLGPLIRTAKINYAFFGTVPAQVHAARPLFLGDVPLVTDKVLWTDDLQKFRQATGRPVMGILGSDCLQNYRVQFDFPARKLRLLDPESAPQPDWGTAFPLISDRGRTFPLIRGNLMGDTNAYTMIDAGDNGDGSLGSSAFRKELKRQKITPIENRTADGRAFPGATFPTGFFGGQTYTNLKLNAEPVSFLNVIGLSFLARHIVTIDFPKQQIYFHRLPAEPPAPQLVVPPGTIGWWSPDFGFTSGESVSSLAERVIAPPNLRPAAAFNQWQVFSHLPIKSDRITNSEAPAILQAVELAPADYHVRISSQISVRPDGTTNLNFSMQPESGKPSPLPEKGTIILLHDYNSQKEFISPWAIYLAQAGYRTVTVDFRGHGESRGDRFTYGKFEIRDLSLLLDDLNRRRIATNGVGVLGVGVGAQIAFQWAVRESRVKSIVALSPSARLETWFTRTATNAPYPIAPELLKSALDAAAAKLEFKWSDWSAETAMPQLKCPVFLIGGGKDTLSPPEDINLLQRSAPPGSKSLQIPRARHDILPVFFHELGEPVIAWFGDHPAGPAVSSASLRH